ncbi:MAG: NapC/NirT family cytochrome c [Chloroflexi bacterium]|nr:NapC/NirT family cytochrome c [Chloroflexota bacterium]
MTWTVRRIALYATLAVLIGLVLVVAGFQTFDYMDRPEFCTAFGCHAMQPQYNAHSVSPHARVDCANCHTGKGIEWAARMRLVTAVREMATQYVLGYERPVKVGELRPARDTCEQCHWPAKFSGPRLRINERFAEDEGNTEKVSGQLFKVGGGGPTVGRGIHWHTATRVYYLPLDEKRQEIAWVGVEKVGKLVEYTDSKRASEISRDRIERDKRLMDCIDCHNRAGHTFRTPAELVDTSLALGKLDATLPFLKKKAVELISGQYATLAEATAAMRSLTDFYRSSYPDIYQKKTKPVSDAVAELKRLVGVSNFPEDKIRWTTYPSNLGHTTSPGCFRCHGKLTPSAAGAEAKPINNDCNLCHVFLPQEMANTLAAK